MIHANRIVTVGDQESIIDRPIVLYRGDREVEIEFTLVGNEFTFSEEGNVIKSVNASHGQLVLNTPSGEHMFSELAECNEGKVVFVVTKEMIDEFIEVGFYSFQIRLYDSAEMISRVTIPPVMNGFDIRNPIAAEDETNVVDQGLVDYARVFKDQSNEELHTFDWTGAYNKTEWAHHDVITENKLNKIEDALYSINANVKESDVVILNTLDQVKNDADAYVKEHIAEVEADVAEFERNLNTGVETFKIDTNAAMTAHKNEVSEVVDGFSGEIESINTQLADKVNKNDLVINIKDFGAKGDGETDDSIAFSEALSYAATESNSSLYIPAGNYIVSQQLSQWFSYAPKIYGDGIDRTKILPTNDILEGEYVFKFYGKEYDGGCITGLRLCDFTIDMKNTYAHAIHLSSLHDMNKIDTISIKNVFGHALHIVSKHSSESETYNCSESLVIDNSQFKGRAYIEDKESEYSLLKAGNSESYSAMVNEIIISNCRFYGQGYTTISTNDMQLNKRSAIELSTYSVGWSIHDCMFNTIYGKPAIQIGLSERHVSRGHRIFSNCFENCGSHGEFQDDTDYINNNCLIYIKGTDYQNLNQIFFNRYEGPITHEYKYVIACSGNTIFENGLNATDIYVSSGSNQIFAMGSFNRDGSTSIGEQYKNAILAIFGEFITCSSKMMICSRGDVVSGNGINQDTKPMLLFGSNVTETSMSNTCGFKMTNEYYDSPVLQYVVNNEGYHIFRPDGSIGLKNLTSEPASPNNSLALVNGELKFKDSTGIWKTIQMS